MDRVRACSLWDKMLQWNLSAKIPIFLFLPFFCLTIKESKVQWGLLLQKNLVKVDIFSALSTFFLPSHQLIILTYATNAINESLMGSHCGSFKHA